LGRTALSAPEVDRAGVLRRVKEGKLRLVNAAPDAGDQRSPSEADLEALSRGSSGWVEALRCGGQEEQSCQAAEVPQTSVAAGWGHVQRWDRGALQTGRLRPSTWPSVDGLEIDAETLRRSMLCAGLWSRGRKRGPYLKRRERKGYFGELSNRRGHF